jgi:hypothetical protein
VHTRMWEDEFFIALKIKARYLFVYLFTNPRVNCSGCYRISDRTICFETGITDDELQEFKKSLSPKVRFFDGWVFVVNSQFLGGYIGKKFDKAIKREKDEIPENIKNALFSNNDHIPSASSDIPSTSPDIHLSISKSNNINKIKEEDTKEEGEINEGDLITGEVVSDEMEIYLHFCEMFNHEPSKYKFSPARKKLICTRLKEFSKDDIMLAIDHASQDNFYSGNNDTHWTADLEYICRSYEKTEKLLNLAPRRTDNGKKFAIVQT